MLPTVSDLSERYLNDNDRQRLRDQTKQPVSWDTGTVYDPPHGDLNDYQVFQSDQITLFPPLTKAKATEVLAEFLTPTEPLPPAQTSAISRLKAAASNPKWDPSLVIKALADLDIAFFKGRLKGHVIAAWATETEMVEKGSGGQKPKQSVTGLCQPIDPKEKEGKQRCKVWLNSDLIFDMPDPRRVMWETMFHELVHAYIYNSTNREKIIDYHFSDHPDHDAQFDYLLSMVDRQSIRHMQMSAKHPGHGHTICTTCTARPVLPGDPDFTHDEQGEILKGQMSDPPWGQDPVEAAAHSEPTA